MISRSVNRKCNQLSTMQHQTKCVYIREVCTHHKCVHCLSFEVAHTTYHMLRCVLTLDSTHLFIRDCVTKVAQMFGDITLATQELAREFQQHLTARLKMMKDYVRTYFIDTMNTNTHTFHSIICTYTCRHT